MVTEEASTISWPQIIMQHILNLSYSTKVKIVIAISALLSVSGVVFVTKAQAPFQNALSTQLPGIELFDQWTKIVLEFQEQTAHPSPEKYNKITDIINQIRTRYLPAFEETIQNDPEKLLVLASALGEIEQINTSAFVESLSDDAILNRIISLNAELGSIIYKANNQRLGVDVPSVFLTNFVFSKIIYNQKDNFFTPLLPSMLQDVPEHLFTLPPGTMLDLARKWSESTGDTQYLYALRLQSHLLCIAKNIMQDQLDRLQFRQNISFICVAIGLLIVITVYSTRVMRTPLANLRFAAQQLAKGSLQHRAKVDSQDEVAKMCAGFNSMAALLEKAVTSTSDVSGKLTETINTITTSAKNFEQNVSDQDRTIGQIADNTEGITQNAQELVEALEGALKVATFTHIFATTAQGSIRTMEDVLKSTSMAALEIVSTLSRLEEKFASLSNIITTLVNVADEANLLFINTALTSSATPHRQSGFGIIASKISELSGQTAFVTLEMEDSIKAILNALATAVTQIHHISQQMQAHSAAAAGLVTQFVTMMQTSKVQWETCTQMQAVIQQQRSSAEQIRHTITLLSQGAKITTRSVRNLYSQIQYLGEASSNLQIIFDRFHFHPR
ncbi:MAG: methyl-accepting chemotaxis protein [Parachlamydiales bacterium]|jgi:methyl-accepting chemotaxis protein